jgi:hypothetical protein
MATATFGKLTNGASQQAFSADRVYQSTATPASSGTIISGTARVSLSASGSSNCNIVLYSDLAGAPHLPLAVSDTVAITNTTVASQTFTFSGLNQVAIVSGTPYWIGIMFKDPGTPNFQISRDNTAGLTNFESNTYPTPPNPWSSGGTSAGAIDAYITYTVAGGTASSRFLNFM